MPAPLLGFDAVARAADIAASEKGPDPVEHGQPCPDLELEYMIFADDPITQFYGVAGDLGGDLVRSHVRRHQCAGFGYSN